MKGTRQTSPRRKRARAAEAFAAIVFSLAAVLCALDSHCPAAAPKAAPPPPQELPTGYKFVPEDVDWDHPVYQTTFDNAECLRDWRLEGGKRMSIEDGCLLLESEAGSTRSETNANHLVCWLTREVPPDFLLEFSVKPADRKQGLNIVFFNTRGLNGENIFEPPIKPREGTFALDAGQRLTIDAFGAFPIGPAGLRAEMIAQASAAQQDKPLDTSTRLLLATGGAAVVMMFMVGLGAVTLGLLDWRRQRRQRRLRQRRRPVPPPPSDWLRPPGWA